MNLGGHRIRENEDLPQVTQVRDLGLAEGVIHQAKLQVSPVQVPALRLQPRHFHPVSRRDRSDPIGRDLGDFRRAREQGLDVTGGRSPVLSAEKA